MVQWYIMRHDESAIDTITVSWYSNSKGASVVLVDIESLSFSLHCLVFPDFELSPHQVTV